MMIARIKALLSHLRRSEGPEREYMHAEQCDTEGRMYKFPGWKRQTYRERMQNSCRSVEDLEFFYHNTPSHKSSRI